MRIHPRQHILNIWRSVVSSSFQDGTWVWGGRDESNSISDAEQLLCLLYPATEVENLSIDRPDAVTDDVLNTLRPLGDSTRIPHRIIDILSDYLARYTDKDGAPVFSGGSYFRSREVQQNGDISAPITDEQCALDVVGSYSMSVSLCLSALGFIDVFRPHTERRGTLKAKIADLEPLIRKRLTCAMVGLLRSFVVNTVEPDREVGQVMLSMVNQSGAPEPAVRKELKNRLARVRARLRDDVRIGLATELGIDNENLLFECGWSWGTAQDAEPIDFISEEIASRSGIADSRPYLYFTVVALDGINDLGSPRTRELNLLDEDQRVLAEALQIRADLTQRYWSTIARFDNERWPLEDIPWRTSDGEESQYYSLLVSAVLVRDLLEQQATEDDLTRAIAVFEELAIRGRITRRVMKDDPAIALHVPGVYMTLKGTDQLGPQLYWSVADFAPLLLKRVLEAAQLSFNVASRDRLMNLAAKTMEHLVQRELRRGPGMGLWDDPITVLAPHSVPPDKEREDRISWYFTERVVEAMVMGAKTFQGTAPRTPRMIESALELLNEADHLLNREMLEVDAYDESAMQQGLSKIETKLSRARRILNERPGTASALALEALQELDDLAVARLDAARSI